MDVLAVPQEVCLSPSLAAVCLNLGTLIPE